MTCLLQQQHITIYADILQLYFNAESMITLQTMIPTNLPEHLPESMYYI